MYRAMSSHSRLELGPLSLSYVKLGVKAVIKRPQEQHLLSDADGCLNNESIGTRSE